MKKVILSQFIIISLLFFIEPAFSQTYIADHGVAKEEVHVLLIEPKGTPNTGEQETAATKVEI